MFKRNVSTFEKIMTPLVATIVIELEKRFVKEVRQELRFMSYLLKTNKQFAVFTSSLYATDVKFHHGISPLENHHESKLYFNDEFHLYRYKTKLSATPSGLAIHASKAYPGSRAGILIFLSKKEHYS